MHVLFTKFGPDNKTAFRALFVSPLLVYELCSCLCICCDLSLDKFGFGLAIHTGRKKLKTNYRRYWFEHSRGVDGGRCFEKDSADI